MPDHGTSGRPAGDPWILRLLLNSPTRIHSRAPSGRASEMITSSSGPSMNTRLRELPRRPSGLRTFFHSIASVSAAKRASPSTLPGGC